MRSILASVVFLAACGGGGSSSTYEANRDVAAAVADHLCARAQECDGLGGATYEECMGSIADEICMDTTCGDDFTGDEGAVASCLEDLDAYPCSAATFQLPPACQSLLP